MEGGEWVRKRRRVSERKEGGTEGCDGGREGG